VSLPELERGGIAVVVATVTAGLLETDVGPDFQPRSALYSTPEEAEAQALAQIELYQRSQSEGRVRLLTSARDIVRHLRLWRTDRWSTASCQADLLNTDRRHWNVLSG
jgi:hypothetical protein